MKLAIENKVALVTGGVQGIGSSISRNLMDEGVTVIATSRSQIALDEFTAEVGQTKGKLITIQTSLTDSNSIVDLINKINAQNLHVDILVNNA